jgi:hypothetical protein
VSDAPARLPLAVAAAGFGWVAVFLLLSRSSMPGGVGLASAALLSFVPVAGFFRGGLSAWPLVTGATGLALAGVLEGTLLAQARGWPVAGAALAGALALGPLAARPAQAWLVGLVGWLAAATQVDLAGAPQRILASGPIHLAIGLFGAAALAMVILAAARGSHGAEAQRFTTTLSGLMPVLGFTGTVAGIMTSLAAMPGAFPGAGGGADPAALRAVLSGLGTAFETTLLGLLGSVAVGLSILILNPFAEPADAG